MVGSGPGQRNPPVCRVSGRGQPRGVLAAPPATPCGCPAALLCKHLPALEPLSTQMLFPFTLDRRCPVVRRGARGLRLLPARPADDRELPAVPSAQSLEVRRPLHEFYKRGKSMICSCNCFPLAQNFPSRSTAAARRAGTAARGGEVWQVRGCKTSPRRGRYHCGHSTGLPSAPGKEKSSLCLQNNTRAATPKQPERAEISRAVTETRPGLFLRQRQLDRSLSEAVPQQSNGHLPFTGIFARGPQRAFSAAKSQWRR